MRVKIWDFDGKLLRSIEGHARRTPQGYHTALYAVDVSPDGKAVASGDRIGEVRIHDPDDGRLITSLKSPSFYTYDAVKRSRSIGGIRCVRFSPDGRHLALGGIGAVTNVDGFVGPMRAEVWNWQSGKRTMSAEHKHKAVLNDIAFAPEADWFVAGGGGDSGGILAVWKLNQSTPIHTAKPKGHLHRLAIDLTGETLYCAGFGGIQIWTSRLQEG